MKVFPTLPLYRTYRALHKNQSQIYPRLPKYRRKQSNTQVTESSAETLNTAPSGSDKAESASSSVSPTTQESVYKTITKRLSLLEANATLSLRYIEEQSQLLRDVFSKMERRHSQKIDSFIAELNSTLVTRLQFFVTSIF